MHYGISIGWLLLVPKEIMSEWHHSGRIFSAASELIFDMDRDGIGASHADRQVPMVTPFEILVPSRKMPAQAALLESIVVTLTY